MIPPGFQDATFEFMKFNLEWKVNKLLMNNNNNNNNNNDNNDNNNDNNDNDNNNN